jgi:Fe-Mn family superoxide dismutase
MGEGRFVMDEIHEKYVQDLKEWSSSLKKYVDENELPKEIITEWNEWNRSLEEFDSSDRNASKIHSLHKQGEALRRALYKRVDSNYMAPNYGQHILPDLPYAYDALEPYIDEEIMRLHHLKHHQSYVDGLNKAEEEIYEKNHEPNILRHWLREQAFNGSGHYLHSIFWENMTPEKGMVPTGDIRFAINRYFGSFPAFKEKFTKVAKSVEGPGWAALLYDPINDRLVLESIEKHQINHLVTMIPLLVLDVWEHAYYLQYKNDKNDYIDSWWNVVNWNNVNSRYQEARWGFS